MDLYFLDHVCSFWTLGRINNHITENSVYFEKGPVMILKGLIRINCEIHYDIWKITVLETKLNNQNAFIIDGIGDITLWNSINLELGQIEQFL